MKKRVEKDITSWVTPKAKIMLSDIGGKGLFALSDINKDEKVVIWKGIYDSSAKSRF